MLKFSLKKKNSQENCAAKSECAPPRTQLSRELRSYGMLQRRHAGIDKLLRVFDDLRGWTLILTVHGRDSPYGRDSSRKFHDRAAQKTRVSLTTRPSWSPQAPVTHMLLQSLKIGTTAV